MEQQTIFNKWVHKKLIIPILVMALFPHMMLLTIFNMNSTFTASFLDLEVDDLQFLFSLAYAAIVCSLFVHVRFFHFFNIRNLLLFMTSLNILILFGMTLTTNTQLILVLRFLQGPLTLLEGSILVPIIMSTLNTKHARIIAYSCLYGFMLTGDKFATSMVKFAIENYDHNMMVYVIMSFHMIALAIYLFLFNQNRMFPKMPLYQLNLGGIFLMLISLISGAFFFVYGKKFLWFESPLILTAFCLMLVFGGMFILHQRSAKRPLFHFEVFKSKRVLLGIFIFFVFYVMRSCMSNLYQVMGMVWKWPWEYVLQIQYNNVIGTIAGVLVAAFMLMKKVDFKIIFIIGFAVLSISILWFSYLFSPDTSTEAIIPPLFLEGVGQGIVFTPLVLFMVGSVHPTISGNVSLVGTAMRFWSTTIGFSIMQNALLYLTTKHQFLMTKNLDQTNPIFQEQWNSLLNKNSASNLSNEAEIISTTVLKTKLYDQALLISNIEVFRTLFVLGISLVLLFVIYRPLKNRLLHR
ncbi:hypothetical protein F0358_11330 [Empedobacter brevis]|uniref:hypothetical protein n=1 Tax=Empedobacter brevis TaxID=247 RepID=UPI00123D41E9|nr:hypothetical protein [Empedobacter brevis]QES93258.1 hypothetical protein F0358_11330 [Empedobacter brevis]